MAAPPKLTKNSKAVRLLRAKFENGEITGKEDPKVVYESEEVFQKHRSDRFRTCYYNMRKEYAEKDGHVGDDDREMLKRRCTKEGLSSSSKKRRLSEGLADEDVDDLHYDESESGACVEIVSGDKSFKPLYLVAKWIEPGTTTKRLSVAVVLPSGIESGNFSLRVVDGGEYLELVVTWPSPSVNISLMDKKWLQSNSTGFQPYHPKFLGFEAALKDLRARSSDTIESRARLPLPFAVQAHIDAKYNLAWRENNVRMVYVDLKAFVEEYAVVNDNDAFEVV